MSFDIIIKVLQVGFSGFVFLMALLSYKLIRIEQDRPEEPRDKILSELKSFRNWALIAAVLVLLSPLIDRLEPNTKTLKTVPNIEWTYTVPPNEDGLFQCYANKTKVGPLVNCKDYGSCGERRRNINVCRGLFYAEAISATQDAIDINSN